MPMPHGSDLFVNLYVGGTVLTRFAAGEVKLRVETDYPWHGRSILRCETAAPVPFALRLASRLVSEGGLKLNGASRAGLPDDSGFWTLDRTWQNGDAWKLVLDMPVQLMIAHPAISSCAGKVALQRGPLVYGFEGARQLGQSAHYVGSRSEVRHRTPAGFAGWHHIIRGLPPMDSRFRRFPLCPGHRGKSAQEVWVEQPSLKQGDQWVLGALYRPAAQASNGPAHQPPKMTRAQAGNKPMIRLALVLAVLVPC